MNVKRLFIVGGVAGGASCAARARRLSESAEITIFEQGPYVSFANCGLPYHVGKVIKKEDSLMIATPELFRSRFNIDVRIRSCVRKIDREKKVVEVENLNTGETYSESYDALVLSPGSVPVWPNLKGIDIPGIFTMWTIPDMREVIQWIKTHEVKDAVVVGGGLIGLEMTENLHRLGIHVSIVEMLSQVMPSLDSEMAAFMQNHLISKGVSLNIEDGVSSFVRKKSGKIGVKLSSGNELQTDLVIMSIGARPRLELAQKAGLKIGKCGGILVNEKMQTSDSHIWAVGDVVEVKNYITGEQQLCPLAGPANRQGRLAADVIFNGSDKTPGFRGVQATSVCGVLGLTVAQTGLSEKMLQTYNKGKIKIPYEKIYIHPMDHAGYYPGAQTVTIKLLFSTLDGCILGAQAVGKAGVEKRIDVISMAIQKNGTVFDLEEAELCYAPPYGSAKDPANMAGMVAANVLRGMSVVRHWEQIEQVRPFMLDVRDKNEFKKGHVPGAVHIPLDELREKLDALPKDREIWTYCFVGQRSYYASCFLRQYGFDSVNVSGGFLLYSEMNKHKITKN